jgi:hypothetical protein
MQNLLEVKAAMAALETAIVATTKARQLEAEKAPWAIRSASDIEPTKWTREIESNLDNPDALEALRVQFDEASITFATAYLAYSSARGLSSDTMSPLCDRIRDIIEILDGPTKLPRFYKQALQALVLRAVETHRAARVEVNLDWQVLDIRSRTYQAMVSAFNVLATDLVTVKARYQSHYKTDLVIEGWKVKPMLNRDVDLRNAYVVPFVDCVNSTHPHNVALVEAHSKLVQAVEVARACEKTLRSDQNGKVNERQHAGRMLDVLHGAPQCCGGNIVDQVKAQNERRVAYETVRLQFLLALDEMRSLQCALVDALVAAGEETATLLAEVSADDRSTIDRIEAVRVAINNCLAVDVYLRRVGREWESQTLNQSRDLTNGNGVAAIAAAYADASKNYRRIKLPAEGGEN